MEKFTLEEIEDAWRKSGLHWEAMRDQLTRRYWHSFREGEVVLMKISELDEEVYCEYKSDPLIQRECRPLNQQEVGPNWVPKEPVKALRAWVDWVAAQGSLLERQRAPYEDVLRAAPLRLAAFDAAVGDES